MGLEIELTLLCLVIALCFRPWRQLKGATLASPLLGGLVVLSWTWALPRLHAMPLQLQISGACAITLMLGWPLAVPTLCVVGLLADQWAPAPVEAVVSQVFWLGVLPSTLALALGALLRRLAGTQPFTYILGRAFAGTVLCDFASSVLGKLAGHAMPLVEPGLSLVAYWLIAWGDGFLTGLMAAIFVAFQPQWLATWSDRLYLHRPPT